jgi:hypothetical protein
LASEAWQIGSDKPPTVCLCCGSKFDEDKHKIRGPYDSGPYRYVCEWCWKKPYMFFQDKVHENRAGSSINETTIWAQAPIIELEVTKGRTIPCRLVKVPIAQLRLNPNNPRIARRLPSSDETEIEDWLWQEEGTKRLYNEVRYSGGLSEKPIVDSSLTVVEGNRRIVCLRKLDSQAKNDELPDYSAEAFETIQCLMLPPETDPKDVDLLVARVHVSGKKEWAPLSQAEQIFDMVNKHNMPRSEVASALSLSSQRIEVMFEAFRATLEYGDQYHDDEGKWMHKFSYFYELFRRPTLRAWAKDGKNFAQFMELISGEKPKLSVGSQVRDLGAMIADKKAYGLLLSDGFERAFEVLKAKQSRIDRYTKTLEQASEALLEITRDPRKLSKDPKRTRVLGDIKQRVDYILSTNTQSTRQYKR